VDVKYRVNILIIYILQCILIVKFIRSLEDYGDKGKDFKQLGKNQDVGNNRNSFN